MAFEYLLIALVWNKVDITVGQYEELNTCLRSAEILENHVANDYSQGYPDKINDSFAELQKLINHYLSDYPDHTLPERAKLYPSIIRDHFDVNSSWREAFNQEIMFVSNARENLFEKSILTSKEKSIMLVLNRRLGFIKDILNDYDNINELIQEEIDFTEALTSRKSKGVLIRSVDIKYACIPTLTD